MTVGVVVSVVVLDGFRRVFACPCPYLMRKSDICLHPDLDVDYIEVGDNHFEVAPAGCPVGAGACWERELVGADKRIFLEHFARSCGEFSPIHGADEDA